MPYIILFPKEVPLPKITKVLVGLGFWQSSTVASRKKAFFDLKGGEGTFFPLLRPQ
jgi:hypothetical protein